MGQPPLLLIPELVSLSLIVILVLPLAFFAFTRRTLFLILFFYTIAFSTTIELIKRNKPRLPPFQRPVDAVGCDLLGLSPSDALKPGYPSGHVATTTMVLLTLAGLLRSPALALFSLLWIYAMAWSRHLKRCHTPLQTTAGAFYGLAAAALFLLFHRLPLPPPKGVISFIASGKK